MALYRRGGGRCCAVSGCTNNQRKLSIWRRDICELHSPLQHNACSCLEPFSFYYFPRDKEKQQAWLEAIGRKDFLPGKGTVVCSMHFVKGSPTAEHPVPVLNMGSSENEDLTESKSGGDERPARKRVYKALLEDTGGGPPTGSAKKLEIDGRYPQGSWEQATVEAIMQLRNFDSPSSSLVAQTTIANLKDENDFLRAQNSSLKAELKSTQEGLEAEVRAVKEELETVKGACRCRVESRTAKPATAEAVPELEGVTVTVTKDELDGIAVSNEEEVPARGDTAACIPLEIGTVILTRTL
nr:PREDICTED: uncharacterized protein LOC107076915 [Lepisosteus oculatus]